MSHLISLTVVLPLAGAVLLLLYRGARPAAAQRIAAGFAAATVGAAVWTLCGPTPEVAEEADIAWWFDDGITLWMLLCTSLLALAAILMTPPAAHARSHLFFGLMLLLQAGLQVVFAAGHIVWLFVAWEASRLSLYFLIGGWGESERRAAAMKFFVFTLVGSGLVLAGCGLLVWSHHWMSGQNEFALNLPRLIEELPKLAAADSINFRYWNGVQPWIFAALACGFAIHVPLFPFHTWLQGAAVEAPTGAMILLCGGWIKIGAYGCARMVLPLFPELSTEHAGYILWPAVIGTVYGALMSLVQDDLKRLAANITINFVSLSLLGLFSGTAAGISGGLLLMVSHGLAIALLIAVTGALFARYGTREAEAYSGLAGRFPRLTAAAMIGVASLMAVPLTGGFIATTTILFGLAAVHAGFLVAALVAIVLCCWCFLRVMQRVFSGSFREPVIDHPSWSPKQRGGEPVSGDLRPRELVAVIPLAAIVLWLGLAPQTFFARIEPAVATIVDLSEAAPPAPSTQGDAEKP